MDVNLKYWNNQKSVAETYIDSVSSSTKCCKSQECFSRVLGSLIFNGPSTSWNSLEKFDDHLVEKDYKKTINIGSCSLHIIHGTFQTAALKMGWQINKFMKAMLKTFDTSPAYWDVYLRQGT